MPPRTQGIIIHPDRTVYTAIIDSCNISSAVSYYSTPISYKVYKINRKIIGNVILVKAFEESFCWNE